MKNVHTRFVVIGVATFCRNNVTPMSAEEGITGCGPQNFSDNVGNPAILTDLSVVYCKDCDDLLCQDCWDMHQKMKLSRSHT